MKLNYRLLAGLLRVGTPSLEALERAGWGKDTFVAVQRGADISMILPEALWEEASFCDDLPTLLEELATRQEADMRRSKTLALVLLYPSFLLLAWGALAAFLGNWSLLLLVVGATALLLWRRPTAPWLCLEEQASFLRWLQLALKLGFPLPEAARRACSLTSARAWKSDLSALCEQLDRGAVLSQTSALNSLATPLLGAEQQGLSKESLDRVIALQQLRVEAVFEATMAALEPALLITVGLLVVALWTTIYPLGGIG